MLISQSHIESPLQSLNTGTVNKKYVPSLHQNLLLLSVGVKGLASADINGFETYSKSTT